jgi:hypothetical protein
MGGTFRKQVQWVGPAILCCTGVAVTALASPPFKILAGAPAAARPPAHLDLRAPAVHESDSHGSKSSVAASSDGGRLSSLGAAMGQNRANAPEQMVQRFHREGLPVARLWESHSALVSIGLNQKGKPGLWLVQKTH